MTEEEEGKEGKGREGKGREGREGKGREGKEDQLGFGALILYILLWSSRRRRTICF